MATWFQGKIRFTKEIDAGKFKTVTEAYLLDAVSFTDAEARLYNHLGDNAPDFRVTSLAPLRIQEVFHIEGSENKWFKSKITITTFDEKTKKEKKTTAAFLINADSIKQAYDRVEDALGRVEDYEIVGVELTPILEVIPYDPDLQTEAIQEAIAFIKSKELTEDESKLKVEGFDTA